MYQKTTEPSVAIDNSANAPSPNMPINSSAHAAMMSQSNCEEGLTTAVAATRHGKQNGEQVEGTTKYSSTLYIGMDEVFAIMPVHSKIPNCTFTFSDNSLLTPQDDS